MGLLDRLLGRKPPDDVDALGLDILMEYDLLAGVGRAATTWRPLKPELMSLAPVLLGSLYGRILGAHTETRGELFSRVGKVAQRNVQDGGASGFVFEDWVLHVGLGGGNHRLWPWEFVDDPETLISPRTYSAHLFLDPQSKGIRLHLDMAVGMERILAPSSVLVALAIYSLSSDRHDRHTLACFLSTMNGHYGSPDNATVAAAPAARLAALSALRPGQIRGT